MSHQSVANAVSERPPYSMRQRALAMAYGVVCHTTYTIGIAAMMAGLGWGMTTGFGRLEDTSAVLGNTLLLLQFPILHSLLLTDAGRRSLSRLAPGRLGGSLSTTTFATISALQIVSVFTLWSPSGVVWWQPSGVILVPWTAAFAVSWLLLLKTMWDAGLGIQTGFHGWGAVARGSDPKRAPFRRTGTFRYVRQPVYVAFALTLWTGPVWTPDHLAIALAWTAYCILGPLLKEKRYLQFYGDAFREYRESVPYWLPLRPLGREPRPS